MEHQDDDTDLAQFSHNVSVLKSRSSCPRKDVTAIDLQTEFLICYPAIFKVSQYKGSPKEEDKKKIKWMIRDAKTKKDLMREYKDIIKERGERLIIKCVPFEWRNRKIQIGAQFDEKPKKELLEETPLSCEVFDWVATIKKAETEYPKWTGVEMTNAMRRVAGYDNSSFQKMYGNSPLGKPLKPKGNLTQTDINNLEKWTKHKNAASGLVKDLDNIELAAGHVLTGISGGVYRNKNIDITPSYSLWLGEKMDNLYAVTISGDLGQAAVFVNEEKQSKPYIGSHGDADDAELIGDIDGFILGMKEPIGGSGKKLSDTLLEYYCSCSVETSFRSRIKFFNDNVNKKYLKDQIYRFARTYIYKSEWVTDAAFSFIEGESEEAYEEFCTWLTNEEKKEEKRISKFNSLKKSLD